MNEINWAPLIIGVIIGGALGAALIFILIDTNGADVVSESEINKRITEAVSTALDVKSTEITLLDDEISNLKDTITNLKNVTGTTVDESGKVIIISKEGYLLDEIFLEEAFSKDLSDRELNLFDDEVEFDGEDYDAEEIFILKGLELRANDNDFDGVAYLTIPEDSISYKFILEASLDTSEIGEDDETLTFYFLGEEVEVSEWETNEITFTQGEEYFMVEKETVTVDGKNITLEFVLNDAAYITVDGEGKKIPEGEIRRVNGIDVKAEEVLYSNSALRDNKAVLVIGEDLEVTINDGDEYSKDSIWEWTVDKNSIGLILIEEFSELDEDFNALSPNDEICLPKDYVCIEYNGLINENAEDYAFELDTRKNIEYVRIGGNFISGINDYDRVYVNATGIYDRDFDLINESVIELGDTDSVLNLVDVSGNLFNITVNDFKTDSGLENIWVGTMNISGSDEDYLTNYGIMIENPENSVEDESSRIVVPEEKLEGSITVKDWSFKETASNN